LLYISEPCWVHGPPSSSSARATYLCTPRNLYRRTAAARAIETLCCRSVNRATPAGLDMQIRRNHSAHASAATGADRSVGCRQAPERDCTCAQAHVPVRFMSAVRSQARYWRQLSPTELTRRTETAPSIIPPTFLTAISWGAPITEPPRGTSPVAWNNPPGACATSIPGCPPGVAWIRVFSWAIDVAGGDLGELRGLVDGVSPNR
jgi:hypothetical protein